MDEKLLRKLTRNTLGLSDNRYAKQALKVNSYLMPLPRTKVLTLYGLIYLTVILAVFSGFYFEPKGIFAGVFICGLIMVLVIRKAYSDDHYLKLLHKDNALVVKEDSIQIPALLTETGDGLTITKHKIKRIFLPWNISHLSVSSVSGNMKRTHVLFTIQIELNNHITIKIPPNCTDRNALIYQLNLHGYELTAEKVETEPLLDFTRYFWRPFLALCVCAIGYGVYTLFQL